MFLQRDLLPCVSIQYCLLQYHSLLCSLSQQQQQHVLPAQPAMKTCISYARNVPVISISSMTTFIRPAYCVVPMHNVIWRGELPSHICSTPPANNQQVNNSLGIGVQLSAPHGVLPALSSYPPTPSPMVYCHTQATCVRTPDTHTSKVHMYT